MGSTVLWMKGPQYVSSWHCSWTIRSDVSTQRRRLAALTTSSYKLLIVCSIDLDPGLLPRQVGDDVICSCKICQDQFKSTKVCIRSATLSDWLIGYRFKFRPISWQSIILGSHISAVSQKAFIRFSGILSYTRPFYLHTILYLNCLCSKAKLIKKNWLITIGTT